MGKDVLVILMMAFGLFAILMFILFYIYAKRYFNEKKLTDDYNLDDEEREYIDILADKMEYTFYADGNTFKKDDEVKVKIDGAIKSGVIVRPNYFEYTRKLKNVPRVLEIVKEEQEEKVPDKEKTNKKVLFNDEMDDFVPTKKK